MMRQKVKAELQDMGFRFHPDLLHGHDYELVFYKNSPIPVAFFGENVEVVSNIENYIEKRKFDEFMRLCAKANGLHLMEVAIIDF